MEEGGAEWPWWPPPPTAAERLPRLERALGAPPGEPMPCWAEAAYLAYSDLKSVAEGGASMVSMVEVGGWGDPE